jgi:hypothetical protein
MSVFARTLVVLLGASVLSCGMTTEDRDLDQDGVRVLEASFGMDCMPVHPPDTARIRIRVEYTNSSSEARQWHIDAGRLELSREELKGALDFPLVPSSSGLVPPGETVVIEHTKLPGTGTGTGTCGFCDSERGRWELFVTWSTPDRSFEQHAGSGNAWCTS